MSTLLFHVSRYQSVGFFSCYKRKSKVCVYFSSTMTVQTEVFSCLKFWPTRFCTKNCASHFPTASFITKLSQNLFVLPWLHFYWTVPVELLGLLPDQIQRQSETSWKSLKKAKMMWWKSKLEKPLALTCVAQHFSLQCLPNSDKQTSSSASPQIFESSQPTKYNLLWNKKKALGLAAVRIYFN